MSARSVRLRGLPFFFFSFPCGCCGTPPICISFFCICLQSPFSLYVSDLSPVQTLHPNPSPPTKVPFSPPSSAVFIYIPRAQGERLSSGCQRPHFPVNRLFPPLLDPPAPPFCREFFFSTDYPLKKRECSLNPLNRIPFPLPLLTHRPDGFSWRPCFFLLARSAFFSAPPFEKVPFSPLAPRYFFVFIFVFCVFHFAGPPARSKGDPHHARPPKSPLVLNFPAPPPVALSPFSAVVSHPFPL